LEIEEDKREGLKNSLSSEYETVIAEGFTDGF
jgi:hypothetical protein